MKQPAQVDNALEAMHRLFKRFGLVRLKITVQAYLLRAADLMEARSEELMVLLCRESGKTYLPMLLQKFVKL